MILKFSGFLKSSFLLINFLAVYRSIQIYIYDFRSAIGPSMIPTIRDGNLSLAGDVLLVDKLTPRFTGYRKQDVVITKSPMKLNSILCKRVIATAGEHAIVEGQKYLVPEGHIWLEGDNKSQSFDSRDFGPVPINLVEGRVILKIWDSIGKI